MMLRTAKGLRVAASKGHYLHAALETINPAINQKPVTLLHYIEIQ